MRRSIRKRLIAGFLGALLFTQVAMGIYLHFRAVRLLEKTVDTFVLEEASLVAAMAKTGDRGALDRQFAMTREVQVGRTAEFDFRVVDHAGKVIAGDADARWPLDRDELARQQPGRGTYLTLTSKQEDGETIPSRLVSFPVDQDPYGTVVQVVSRTSRQQRDLARADHDYLLGAAAIFALAALLSARLVRRALLPVSDMVRDARAIHAEDLSGRIEGRGTQDELDKLARILNELLDRLQRSVTEVRQFTAEAAHELRTPLTRIRGEVELLLRESLPADARASLAGVVEELDRLGAMVRDLLALSRADAGTVLATRESLSLDALVEELVEQGRVLVTDRSLSIEVGPMEAATVVGDPGLLKRLLWNLLDNAVRYSDPGGRIRVAVSSQGTESVVSMEDTGMGIPPEELSRIFDRFYRGKQARQRWADGTGLGLALCRAIARAHGGELFLASEVGKGTRVELRLPRALETGEGPRLNEQGSRKTQVSSLNVCATRDVVS